MTIGWVEISEEEWLAVYDYMQESLEVETFRDVSRIQTVQILRDSASNLPVLKHTISEYAVIEQPITHYINGVFYDGDSKTD